MPWVNIDDGFEDHPKLVKLLDNDEHGGLIAVGVFTLLLSRCARRLTDGKFSQRDVAQISAEYGADAVAALRAVGFVDEADGQLSLHDYLDWNPSREKVLAKREARANAGAKGGKTKAANLAAGQAGALANASPGASKPAKQRRSNGAGAEGGKSVPTTTTTTTVQDQGLGGGGAREHDRDGIDEALRQAGFEQLSVEQDFGAIGQWLGQEGIPLDTDWHEVGRRLKRKRDGGHQTAARPVSALRFLHNGHDRWPLVGDAKAQAAGMFRQTGAAHPDAADLDAKYGELSS